MGLKEFVKFSWKKVLIFIIIVCMTILSVVVSGFFTRFCGLGIPCPPAAPYYFFMGISYVLALPVFIFLHLADLFIGTGFDYALVIIGWVLTPIYIYLLSCFIELLTEKVKSKSQLPSRPSQD